MALQEMFPAVANSPATELSAAITDIQTTITLLDASKLPDAPNIATIGVDETAETVRYEGKNGNDLTGVTRGFSGTVAKAWGIGSGVARYFTAYDADALRENVAGHSAELVTVNARLAEGARGATAVKNRLIGGFVAHRGLQPVAPENTIKAIRAAAEAGFSMVEIDPTQTSDLKWVLMHDPTVDRTTNGTGTVASMTLAQILDLYIDSPTSLILEDEVIRVPTLREALEEISSHGMGVNIDGSKFSNTNTNFQEIIDLLDEYNLTSNSLFILPSELGRQMVRQISPYITVGWVSTVANVDNDIAEAKTLGNVVVGYSSSTLTDEIVYKCNSANVPIYAYLANTYEQAYKWLSKGVLYVETDFYYLPGGTI